MESFGHKMIISSQPVPLTGTGVLYPCVRYFFFTFCNARDISEKVIDEGKDNLFQEQNKIEIKNLAREDTRLPFLLKELLWRKDNFVTKWFHI